MTEPSKEAREAYLLARTMWHDVPAATAIIQSYGEAVSAEKVRRIAELEAVLAHIAEYWNRDRNDSAMFDACWFAINEAEQALEGGDHLTRAAHNPAEQGD